MAYREVSRVEIAEVVRRWQSGNSQRQIATGTGLSRATVRRYIVAAMGAGLTRDGPAPSEDHPVRPGVQPWELPSPAVPAQGGQPLVAAERAGQADQDGRPSGAALPVVDLSVVRGVGSSTVVPGSVGSYRPVIAGPKLRENATTILSRGGERSRESACPQYAFTPLAGARRRQRRTRNMVHGKNRIPYRIDRRLSGLAGPDYDATISFGLPLEPEDSQYGKSRMSPLLQRIPEHKNCQPQEDWAYETGSILSS